MPFCKKHPSTELVIRQGKRKQNFVVCPECKPDSKTAAAPKTAPPAAPPAAEKKNAEQKSGSAGVKWYDRVLIG